MLDWYHGLAKRLHGIRGLLWLLAGGSCLAFLAGLFMRDSGNALFLGALVVLLWSVLMLATAHSFAQPAPAVDPQAGWLARIKTRCLRAYLWLLAIATTALAGFVVFLSLRSVALIARSAGG